MKNHVRQQPVKKNTVNPLCRAQYILQVCYFWWRWIFCIALRQCRALYRQLIPPILLKLWHLPCLPVWFCLLIRAIPGVFYTHVHVVEPIGSFLEHIYAVVIFVNQKRVVSGAVEGDTKPTLHPYTCVLLFTVFLKSSPGLIFICLQY